MPGLVVKCISPLLAVAVVARIQQSEMNEGRDGTSQIACWPEAFSIQDKWESLLKSWSRFLLVISWVILRRAAWPYIVPYTHVHVLFDLVTPERPWGFCRGLAVPLSSKYSFQSNQ